MRQKSLVSVSFFLIVTITKDLLGVPAQRPLVAFGELRGHLEPCGCNPETDLGGILRLVKGIATLKQSSGTELVLSTGNNIGIGTPGDKDVVILEALNMISPDAILLNHLEQQQLGWLRAQARKLPQIEKRFVLSNQTPSVKVAALAQTVIVKGEWLIFGFRQTGAGVETWSESLLKRMKDIASRHEKATKKLLLFEGDDATLSKVSETDWFSQIIVANRTPMSEEPSPREKEQPGKLLLSGKYYMVPSFGQGILAPQKFSDSTKGLSGGILKGSCLEASVDGCGSPAPRRAGQFKIPTLKLPIHTISDTGPFIWLDRTWHEASPAEALIDGYNKKQELAFQSKIDERLAKFKVTTYAGSKACATCHADAFNKWQSSPHAKAYEALKKVGKASDSECVSCHVLAFDGDGGFVSEQHTPDFAGVNCENCHGPRKEHVSNPTKKGSYKAETVCVSCHKEPHSYHFDFKKYWPKIEHR